jgi:hypothetical protein
MVLQTQLHSLKFVDSLSADTSVKPLALTRSRSELNEKIHIALQNSFRGLELVPTCMSVAFKGGAPDFSSCSPYSRRVVIGFSVWQSRGADAMSLGRRTSSETSVLNARVEVKLPMKVER